MIWASITILLIFLAGSIFIVFGLWRKSSKARYALIEGLSILEEEESKRNTVLAEVSELLKTLISSSELEENTQRVSAKEEELRAERGRVTIAQAEHDALETRLREMEEVERELEASYVEAEREVDMLRTQEKELQEKRAEVKKHLSDSTVALELILEQVDSIVASNDHIVLTKKQLGTLQEKIEWYSEQIGILNRQYMDLKRAYDSLDIEYAQLYEKQNEIDNANKQNAKTG